MLSRRQMLARSLALCVPAGAAALLTGCAKLVPRSAGPPAKAKAPPFSLVDHRGKTRTLAELIERGPALVVFYRGFW